MMLNLYQHFGDLLNDSKIFNRHEMVCRGRCDLEDIGRYRAHDDPMQTISNRLDRPEVFFEAPPSKEMAVEMSHFISCFNETAPGQKNALLLLTRTGITHVYFLCIHPIEDGNRRIARASSEKVLSLEAGQASLISISQTIEASKKNYYSTLQAHNHSCELSIWLEYFAETVLNAHDQEIYSSYNFISI